MVGAQHLGFRHLKADIPRNGRFYFIEIIFDKLAQNQFADIMQQGSSKYFLGRFDFQLFDQTLGCDRDGNRMAPQFTRR